MSNDRQKTNIDFELVRSKLSTEVFNIMDSGVEYGDEWLTYNSISNAFIDIGLIAEQYETSKQSLINHLDHNDNISNEAIKKVADILSLFFGNLTSASQNVLSKTTKNIDLPYTATVSTDASNLRIRSGRGTEYDILGRFENGEVINIGETKDGWTEVKLKDGTKGYVSSKYLKTNNIESITNYQNNSKPTTKYGTATVSTDGSNLRIRSGRGAEYDILGRFENGEVINIGETKDGWTEVKLKDGTIGYVSDNWIKINDGEQL